MTGGTHPLSGLHIDLVGNQPDRRTALIQLHERVFRLRQEDGIARELRELSELEDERADLRRIRTSTAGLPRP
jgi:hypothetical protein